MSTQEQDITNLIKKVEVLQEIQTSSNSKGALVEKLTFAGIPIMFSCIVYLMSALSSTTQELTTLKNKAFLSSFSSISMLGFSTIPTPCLKAFSTKGISNMGSMLEGVELNWCLKSILMSFPNRKRCNSI